MDGPGFDPFGYNVNGTFFQLTDDNGADAQSGTATVAVTAGDVFAFEQQSNDCILGAGATTVVEFFACIEQEEDVCTHLIIRTHTAVDECDNASSCIQTIFIEDTTAPEFTFCPQSLTIECDQDSSPDNTGIAIATDNCDVNLAVTYTDATLPGSCPQESTITRTWTATDNCGNSTECVQVIVVDDSTPPVIECPGDLVLECDDVIPGTLATATDNCSETIAITYSDIMCDNPVVGFTGIYDGSNWTIILPPQGGSVTPMGDTEVLLVSPDVTVGCDDASVLYSTIIPSTGQLVFDWNYQTNDVDGPGFDPFGHTM